MTTGLTSIFEKIMQALTSKAKQVGRKPMTLWEKLYIPGHFKGMSITFGTYIQKKTDHQLSRTNKAFQPGIPRRTGIEPG